MRPVGIFFCDCHRPEMPRLAEKCVSSIRKSIPGAHVVQFSDPHTKKFSFVDEVVRRTPENMGLMEFRIEHFAHYPHTEALFLDPDIIVQVDVWDVFEEPFDVALTERSRTLVVDGKQVDNMPYNTGVMFSRGNAFWKRVLELMKPMSTDDRNWFGEQITIAKLADTDEFRVKKLPGEQYNYSPKSRDEDVSQRLIVHYKGNRKGWM